MSAKTERQSARATSVVKKGHTPPVHDASPLNEIHSRALVQRMQSLPRSLNSEDALHLQKTIGNRAIAQLFPKGPSLRPPSDENRTGLTDRLKSGVEHLSGLSMNDVRVHFNSPEPDKIDALAFAQGNEIHLGPSQEKYLPHEVWHVVQQSEGRVAPTDTVNGVHFNDDQQLEREAHVMGQQALMMADGVDSGPATQNIADGHLQSPEIAPDRCVVQREKKHFPTLDEDDPTVVKYKAAIATILDDIDTQVSESRKIALQWRNFLDSDQPHLANWAKAAKEYFDNPMNVPDFIHARFGYAIEQLTCDNLNTDRGELSIDFQVTEGSTRPDIVVTVKDTKQQIAWIDLTSKDSENHIMGKAGGGWRTRPFVYEIFYDPLRLNEVLTSSSDPIYLALGGYLSERHEITREEQSKKLQELSNQLLGLQETNKWATGYGNAKTKSETTRDFLRDTVHMDLGDSSLISTKGALSLTNINSGPFGFKGKTSNSLAARQWVNQTTAPTIKTRQDELEKNLLEGVFDDTAGRQELPFVGHFFSKYWDGDPDSRNKVMTGLAVQIGVDRVESLEGLLPGIDIEDPNQLQQNAKTHLGLMPQTADAKELQSWVNSADIILQSGMRFTQLEELGSNPLPGFDMRITPMQNAIATHIGNMPDTTDATAQRQWTQQADVLIGRRELLRQTMQTQQNLIQYLQHKYKAYFTFSMQTPQENHLLAELNKMPTDNTAILQAQQYMV
jgi:hypothetical protein